MAYLRWGKKKAEPEGFLEGERTHIHPRTETHRAEASSRQDTDMKGARGRLSDRVLSLLAQGKSIPAVARECGTSEVFVTTMFEHFSRLGLAMSASSLCSSGLGACSTPHEQLSEGARVTCAGCPLAL